jgi:hypothetical protein
MLMFVFKNKLYTHVNWDLKSNEQEERQMAISSFVFFKQFLVDDEYLVMQVLHHQLMQDVQI